MSGSLHPFFARAEPPLALVDVSRRPPPPRCPRRGASVRTQLPGRAYRLVQSLRRFVLFRARRILFGPSRPTPSACPPARRQVPRGRVIPQAAIALRRNRRDVCQMIRASAARAHTPTGLGPARSGYKAQEHVILHVIQSKGCAGKALAGWARRWAAGTSTGG